MANDVNHLVNFIYKTVGLTKVTKDTQTAEKALFKLTGSALKGAKVLSTNVVSGVNKAGKAMQVTSFRVQKGSKQMEIAVGKVGKVYGILNTRINQFSKSAKNARGSTAGLLGALGRVAIVAPVWLAFRSTMLATIRLIQSSVKFLKDWEFQMAQIRIVSSATNSEMTLLSASLISLSKNLGISNKDLGEGAKLWAQQGRVMNEILPLMNATAKLSLLTGRTIVTSVEDLTAVLKAYKLEATDAISIVDSITAVMLKHAITAGDLAQAYKQTASTASALGVSLAELTGFITAIKTETRDTGSKVGLSLRTMFSRMTTSSKQAIQQLTQIPFHLDRTGNATNKVTPQLRNLGDIIAELSLKFNQLSNAEQSQLAKLIGGVRRQNQVFALFNNFTEAVEAQAQSLFALGDADRAIGILTDTLELRVKRLGGAWSEFINTVSDTSGFKGAIGTITSLVEGLTFLTDPIQARGIKDINLLTELEQQQNAIKKVALGFFDAEKSALQLAKTLERNPEFLEEMTVRTQVWVENANKAIDTINRADTDIKLDRLLPEEILNPQDFADAISNLLPKVRQVIFQQISQTESTALKKEIKKFEIEIEKILKTAPRIIIRERGPFAKIDIDKDALQDAMRLIKEFKKELTPEDAERLKEILNITAFLDENKAKAFSKLVDDLVKKRGELATIPERQAEKEKQVNALIESRKDIEKVALDTSLQNFEVKLKETKILTDAKANGESTLQIEIKKLALAKARNDIDAERASRIKIIQETEKLESSAIKFLISSQAKLLSVQGLSSVNVIRATIQMEKQLGVEQKGLGLLKQRIGLVQAIAKEQKISTQDRLKALQTEIQIRKREADPIFQRRQERRARTLTRQAERAGFSQEEIDKFLKVPTLEENIDLLGRIIVSDMPREFGVILNPLESGVSRLTTVMEDLKNAIIRDAQKISGLDRAKISRIVTPLTSSTGQTIPKVPTDTSPVPEFTARRFGEGMNQMIEINIGDRTVAVNANFTDKQLQATIGEMVEEKDKKYVRSLSNGIRDILSRQLGIKVTDAQLNRGQPPGGIN